jgi:DNA modification methylase
LETIILLTHQARYRLNLNYVIVVKQDINKLLATRFIQFVEEATWLSPIVIVLKKNGKLKICIDFKKLNVTTKKDPYLIPFIDEMINIVVGYEAHYF